MMSRLRKALDAGPAGVTRALVGAMVRPFHLHRVRHAPEYQEPSQNDLLAIEAGLRASGLDIQDYFVELRKFEEFRARFRFPTSYHGGPGSGVYTEKLLEHFVAWDILKLDSRAERFPYVDIASASSPWAMLLREQGLTAFSMDLNQGPAFAGLDYYLQGDATASPFSDSSVGSASLQCAYEMFAGDADTRLLDELSRILRPGGSVVISPLYMHTCPCYYQSPEFFGRLAGDSGSAGFVRRHARGVPVSRKYSPASLLERVVMPAQRNGLTVRILVLRNADRCGDGIYLRFILCLDKPL